MSGDRTRCCPRSGGQRLETSQQSNRFISIPDPRLRFFMQEQSVQKLQIEDVIELWLRPRGEAAGEHALGYRPAMLVECSVNFRSLRAGLNHSEERSYTAWLPEGDMAIDWDKPAATVSHGSQLAVLPDRNIHHKAGNYLTTKADLEQYEAELNDKLSRSERLRLFFNPVFGLFSAPGDALEEFLSRVAEAALGRVEPEMRRLRGKFELQLEQVREAHTRKGLQADNLSLEDIISRNLHFFESENRLAGMFSTLAGSVFGTTEPRSETEEFQWQEAELRDDLNRVEQEASEALRELYGEYLTLANEHDTFEIGLQPDNIQITRRALLWVPVADDNH